MLAFTAGCNDEPVQSGAERYTPKDPEPSTGHQPLWGGKKAVDVDTGELTAPGFNEYVDRFRPAWAGSLDGAGAELLNLSRGYEGSIEIYLLTEEDDGRPVATFTLTKLGDDSVQAERHRLVFDRGADGLHRFVSGRSTRKCQSGRGHQGFETGRCG